MAGIVEVGLAVISFLGILIAVLSSVIAWLTKRVWELKTKDLTLMDERVKEIESIIIGVDEDATDEGLTVEVDNKFSSLEKKLDDLSESVAESERRRREEHKEVRSALIKVIRVLDKKEDINGDLPDEDDL